MLWAIAGRGARLDRYSQCRLDAEISTWNHSGQAVALPARFVGRQHATPLSHHRPSPLLGVLMETPT